MTDRAPIPPDEQRLIDGLEPTRENIRRAWCYGRLYGRGEAHEAIGALPSVFGTFDHEPLTFDGPKFAAVQHIAGELPRAKQCPKCKSLWCHCYLKQIDD